MEFDIPDGLKRRASKFCTNTKKNKFFRPPGCRDWAQTWFKKMRLEILYKFDKKSDF